MSRTARYKSPEAATYHLLTRVAGFPHEFPLQTPQAQRQLIHTFRLYIRAYRCCLYAFSVMGNHYHLILRFEKFRPLPRCQLQRAARRLYGKRWKIKTRLWKTPQWTRFNQRLFDVSALMQHINGEYAKWFNRQHGRRGHFWGERFKNPELRDLRATQECLLYVELNAVRAGLVPRPEHWQGGSAYWRVKGPAASFLVPLCQLFPATSQQACFEIYRARLYARGAVDQTSPVQPSGSPPERPALLGPGLFRSRLRFFSDGLVIGSRSDLRDCLARFRQQGRYRRRQHPIPQLQGYLYTLREQRSLPSSPEK